MKNILAAVATILSSVAFCQDTVWVKTFSRKLQPFERRYLQYTEMKDGMVKLSSLMTRKAEKINYLGKDQLLIVQTYRNEKSIDRDSSYADAATMQPSGYFTDIQSEGHKEKVLFLPDGIKNTIEFKDSTTGFIKPNNQWYNGVITDDIIACLPLKENAVFAFKAINPGKRYFEYTVVITVEEKENVDIPGIGKLACWRLRKGEENSGSWEWVTVKEQIQVKKKFVFKNGNIFYRILMAG